MSPKIRQSLYYVGTIIPALLGLALVWGGIDQGAADNLGDIIAGLFALLGASAPAVAAKKVNEQRKDGTLDIVPAAEQVVKSVEQVIQDHANASAALEQVRNAVTSAVGVVPGFGPLAQQVINSVPIPHF